MSVILDVTSLTHTHTQIRQQTHHSHNTLKISRATLIRVHKGKEKLWIYESVYIDTYILFFLYLNIINKMYMLVKNGLWFLEGGSNIVLIFQSFNQSHNEKYFNCDKIAHNFVLKNKI